MVYTMRWQRVLRANAWMRRCGFHAKGGHIELSFQLYMRRSPRAESQLLMRALFCGRDHPTILKLIYRFMTPAQRAVIPPSFFASRSP